MAAELLNQPVTLIAENNHKGSLPFSDRGVSVDKENIIVSAIKRSEDNKGIVIRAYECDGKNTWEEVLMTEFKK